jgi:hypothetical protein
LANFGIRVSLDGLAKTSNWRWLSKKLHIRGV